MQWLTEVWNAHGALIVAIVGALLPSLITGLSAYPQARGVVTVLRQVFSIFSLVTHRDSAGTFKAPFLPCPPPVGASPPAPSSAAPVVAALLIPLLALAPRVALAAAVGPESPASPASIVAGPSAAPAPSPELAEALARLDTALHNAQGTIPPPSPRFWETPAGQAFQVLIIVASVATPIVTAGASVYVALR